MNATWVEQHPDRTGGYQPAYCYRLIRAHQVYRIVSTAVETFPPGLGERALQPLTTLSKRRPDPDARYHGRDALGVAQVSRARGPHHRRQRDVEGTSVRARGAESRTNQRPTGEPARGARRLSRCLPP